MYLYYYKDKPNFGDAINPILANKIWGNDFFDSDCAERVLFIGTIIDVKPPAGTTEIIIGAGAPYTWRKYTPEGRTIYGVRGPLTCDLLGIDRKFATIDPAILVSRYFTAATGAAAAFMPHHESHRTARSVLMWACEAAGITYINPLDDPLKIMAQIAGSSSLTTEALHGAITAEAYGVPWVPVIFSSQVRQRKWHDFTATIGSEYRPVNICNNMALDGKIHPLHRLKFALALARLGKRKHLYLPVKPFTQAGLDTLIRDLIRLKQGPFVKSSNAVKAESIRRLDASLDKFAAVGLGGSPQ
jgi:succinoglycan biosynthesis protein ExoV